MFGYSKKEFWTAAVSFSKQRHKGSGVKLAGTRFRKRALLRAPLQSDLCRWNPAQTSTIKASIGR